MSQEFSSGSGVQSMILILHFPMDAEVSFSLLTQRPLARIPALMIFFPCYLVYGQHRDGTHLVLMQGISQMKLAAHA